jgi:hypothetical protein
MAGGPPKMKLNHPHVDVPNLEEKLEYISDLLRSLRVLASEPELRDLMYNLEKASLTARELRLCLQASNSHFVDDLPGCSRE